jgi:hypothetical protein
MLSSLLSMLYRTSGAKAGQGASMAAAVSTAGRTTAAAGTAECHGSLKEFEFFFPLIIMVPDSEVFFNFFRFFPRSFQLVFKLQLLSAQAYKNIPSGFGPP